MDKAVQANERNADADYHVLENSKRLQAMCDSYSDPEKVATKTLVLPILFPIDHLLRTLIEADAETNHWHNERKGALQRPLLFSLLDSGKKKHGPRGSRIALRAVVRGFRFEVGLTYLGASSLAGATQVFPEQVASTMFGVYYAFCWHIALTIGIAISMLPVGFMEGGAMSC